MKKLSIFLLALVASTGTIFASDIQVNGIWYDFDVEHRTATVTYRGSYSGSYTNEYTGSVVIPASVTYIDVEYSVTSIGDGAFGSCRSLTSVTIPNSVTSIGYGAFSRCTGLTSIEIPNSVTSIGGSAFEFCTGLTSIVVQEGNLKYDSRESCNAVIESSTNRLVLGCKNSIIPNSVTSIGSSAFYGCSGLTSVTIPNSVKSIGIYAFYACSGLTSVTIGNSVTSIGGFTFYNCSGLTSITNYATTPQSIDSYVFYNVYKSTCVLNVPKESVSLYQAAAVWREFTNIVGVDAPQGVEKVLSDKVSSTKLIRNGNVYILTDDKTYTITGQQVK